MLHAVAQGFIVNEETLTVDTIHQTSPQNHFLTADHTLDHMDEVWQPAIIDCRSSWDDWVAQDRPTTTDRARNMARQFFSEEGRQPVRRQGLRRVGAAATQFLSDHEPEPLACAAQISEIIAAYEKM